MYKKMSVSELRAEREKLYLQIKKEKQCEHKKKPHTVSGITFYF